MLDKLNTDFCKTCRDFMNRKALLTFALSNEKRSCRSMDRTLAYEAWNRGSTPLGSTNGAVADVVIAAD